MKIENNQLVQLILQTFPRYEVVEIKYIEMEIDNEELKFENSITTKMSLKKLKMPN